jgi:hypothetical protein
MAYNKLTPEEQFKTYYRAQVQLTDQKVIMHDPNSLYTHNPNKPYTNGEEFKVERVVSIKMPESDYKNFMDGFGKYIELIHGVQDPIIADMFHQVMMMIRLKQ